MKQSVLLSSAYLPPVQWFTKLMVYENVFVEQCDHYIKQTYRNRCVIATQAGVQALTIPVTLLGNKCPMRDVNHLHRLSLVSAYENSPFFEFYADDLLPFYEKSYEFLIDFNQELTAKVCELLDIDYNAVLTKEYANADALDADDYRDAINPKHPTDDPFFTPKEYYQVFAQRNGFKSNLSIADLLFNEGPEGIITLQNCVTT